MDIGILGPLVVRHGDHAIEVGTRKSRIVLAALVLGRNRVVSAGTLVDAAWPDALPDNPRAALQTSVARLRHALAAGPGGADRLETAPSGYRLHTEEGEVDADRFEALVASGRRALAGGDPGAAAARLREALRLWRGPLLDDLGDLAFAESDHAQLSELRITATVDRLEADLALGRHREIIGELETLAAAHPLREDIWIRLVLALYRDGRQPDAVGRCHEIERRLAEDLGLRPSAELRAIEQRVLQQDPDLDEPAQRNHLRRATARAESAAVSVPRSIARLRTAPLVGRTDELDALLRVLTSPGAALRIGLVTGEPGIGKTRLVAEVAATLGDQGTTVLYGRCDPAPLIPYQPVVEIVGQVIDRHATELCDRLGPGLADLGRLVPDLAHRLPGVERPAPAPADAVRYLTAQVVARVLEVAALQGPLVVVCDDLHWADPATIELLRHLLLTPDHSLAVLLTRRPEGHDGLDDLVATASRGGSLHEVVLGGLSADETSALVSRELPEGGSPWLGRSVHQHTGGNAFFALELARHLASRGEPVGSLVDDLPAGVVSVVQRRIEELGPGGMAVLKTAALAGAEFDAGIVLDACAHADAEAGLAAADAARIITALPDAAGRYSFAHGITRSVLDRSVAAGEREIIHTRLAESIAAASRTAPTPHAALAYHWSRAGMAHANEAAEHSELGAEDAMERRAFEEAAERCAVGIGALEAAGIADRRRLRLLLLAAEAADATSDRIRASALAGQARDLARHLGSDDGFARAALTALPVLPDPASAAILDDALVRIGAEHPSRPMLLASLACMLAGSDVERADALIRDVRMQASGDVEVLHRVLEYDVLFGDDVSPQDRIAGADAILELTAGLRPSVAALDAHTMRGTALLELGDLRAAEQDFAAHAALATELRSPGALAVDDQRRAMRALLAGRLAEAEAHVHEAMLHVSDDPAWVGVYGAQLMAIKETQGRYGDILALLDLQTADDAARPVARAARAQVMAHLGPRPAASAVLHELLSEHPSWRRDLFWTVATTILADAAVALGDEDAAEQISAALEPLADRVAVIAMAAVCRGSVARFVAPMAAMLGRLDDAVAYHEQAMSVHTRLGAAAFLVRDELGLAAVLRQRGGTGDTARSAQHLASATEAAGRLGLTHLVSRDTMLDVS